MGVGWGVGFGVGIGVGIGVGAGVGGGGKVKREIDDPPVFGFFR